MKEYFLIYYLGGKLTIKACNKIEIGYILAGTNLSFLPENCIGSDWDSIDNIPEGKFAIIKGILIAPRPTQKMVWRGRFD